MINKIIRSSTSVLLALAVMAPAATFANEGQDHVSLNFGAKVGSFLHIPGIGAKANLEARSEMKAERKENKVERKEAKTELKVAANLKASAFPGAVTAVNGDGSFTVTGDNGKVVKVTAASTTKVRNRNVAGVIADVIVGAKVIVRGAWNDDKTVITAAEIQIVDSTTNPIRDWFKTLFSLHVVTGTVAAINGNTLTVTGENNTSYTVDITGAKLVSRNPFNFESTADLKVGDKVQVLGNISGTSVSAQIVHDLTVSK